GIVVRVLNPTDDPLDAQLTIGVPIVSVESVRLDETPDGGACARDRNSLHYTVPAHGLRSLRLRPVA
ncbi:MAG TPA: hypothetical protein VL049_09685, partial [Candidatus Dormibacteraeota bacterium]|nr:hypothetical protein [Candidatus Dormibacteraeota bacterium]